MPLLGLFIYFAKRNLDNTFLNKSLEIRCLGQTASHNVYTYAFSLLLATLSLPILRARLQDASLSQSIAYVTEPQRNIRARV